MGAPTLMYSLLEPTLSALYFQNPMREEYKLADRHTIHWQFCPTYVQRVAQLRICQPNCEDQYEEQSHSMICNRSTPLLRLLCIETGKYGNDRKIKCKCAE